MVTTTRTLNPLPFESLQPKRFEDLIRQLAYDFRNWRMLEATGRAGSDNGYDARGFEIVGAGDTDEPKEESDEEVSKPEAIRDNRWLIQCKRERSIAPAKMKQHLAWIPAEEANSLYGVIIAAACDFSKKTRDVVLEWARERGVAEVHLWGKAEVEDQLFQPKNDYLLFAYFGISLQIRRRSIKTALRAMLAMKRKVMRHVGDGWRDNRIVLLRDPEDKNYPYTNGNADPKQRGWCVTEFAGNHFGGIKIRWRRHYAYLAEDGRHWDCANVYSDRGLAGFQDAWMSEDEREKEFGLRQRIEEFRREKLPESQRAYADVECFIPYEEIIEIDEKGDRLAQFPHLFVPFRQGVPQNAGHVVKLTVPIALEAVSEPRKLVNPKSADRLEMFPSEFRKQVY